MNEAQIKELVAQLLSEKSAELTQQFSDKLAAKDEEIQSLKSELANASETAQQFSNSVAESAFTGRVNGLVAAGIPAAVVHAVADIARNLRGTEQKLSNGSTVDTAEALFKALELMPGEARVNYEQVGQSLSDTSESDPYADIVNRFNSAK